MKPKVSQASVAVYCGLKKWGIFEENWLTFLPTTLFIFVQNKQMAHHMIKP